MWGLYSSLHGYGFDDYGVDRSGWSDKSDAALRRESQAKDLFDAFLEKCSAHDADNKSLFPITEEVVKADVHLTGPCYTSFRKHAMSKGCKVKRREATHAERKASGDSRKGKLYVISITCPVHPGKAAEAKKKAVEAAAARKKKAQEAAERKAEKERKEREERARLAALHRAKVRERYEDIVGEGDDAEDGKRKQTPPKKPSTMDSFAKVVVSPDDLLKHAQNKHANRASEIRTQIREEQAQLMAELHKRHDKEESELRTKMINKQTELLGNANTEHDEIKAKIEEVSQK